MSNLLPINIKKLKSRYWYQTFLLMTIQSGKIDQIKQARHKVDTLIIHIDGKADNLLPNFIQKTRGNRNIYYHNGHVCVVNCISMQKLIYLTDPVRYWHSAFISYIFVIISNVPLGFWVSQLGFNVWDLISINSSIRWNPFYRAQRPLFVCHLYIIDLCILYFYSSILFLIVILLSWRTTALIISPMCASSFCCFSVLSGPSKCKLHFISYFPIMQSFSATLPWVWFNKSWMFCLSSSFWSHDIYYRNTEQHYIEARHSHKRINSTRAFPGFFCLVRFLIWSLYLIDYLTGIRFRTSEFRNADSQQVWHSRLWRGNENIL